jgi:virginiamycin B lyase
VPGPDGAIWFVLAEGNAIARVTPDGAMREFPLPTPNASPRGIVVARGNEIWFTQNIVNRIGRMSLDGEMLGEYDVPTPGSGPRAMVATKDGRLFFSQHDAGSIGEIRLPA